MSDSRWVAAAILSAAVPLRRAAVERERWRPCGAVQSAASSANTAGQRFESRVFDSQAIGGASVAPDGLTAVTTSGDGAFTIQTQTAGDYKTTVSASGFFDRRSTLRLPGARAAITLIPRSFDISSFDQMLRASSARLQRWARHPAW